LCKPERFLLLNQLNSSIGDGSSDVCSCSSSSCCSCSSSSSVVVAVVMCGSKGSGPVCRVSVSELQTRLEFDIDSNGEVSEDEAKVSLSLTYLIIFSWGSAL